jgi:hypothetical protein
LNCECHKLHRSIPTGRIHPGACSNAFQHQHLNRRSSSYNSKQAGLPEKPAAYSKPCGFWTQSRKSRSAAHTEQKKDRNTTWHNHPIISNVAAAAAATATAAAAATIEALTAAEAVSAAS